MIDIRSISASVQQETTIKNTIEWCIVHERQSSEKDSQHSADIVWSGTLYDEWQ